MLAREKDDHGINSNEVIERCKARDFKWLFSFLTSDIMELPWKVLASTVINCYHPELNKRKEYSLGECWIKKYSSSKGWLDLDEQSANVGLYSLAMAYLIAKNPVFRFNKQGKDFATIGLADEVVAEKIKTFVHKYNHIFSKHREATAPVVQNAFGNIAITSEELQAKQNTITVQRNKKYQATQVLTKQAEENLEQQFKLPTGSCHISKFTGTNECNIYLEPELPNEVSHNYAKLLTDKGIKAKVIDCYYKDKLLHPIKCTHSNKEILTVLKEFGKVKLTDFLKSSDSPLAVKTPLVRSKSADNVSKMAESHNSIKPH